MNAPRRSHDGDARPDSGHNPSVDEGTAAVNAPTVTIDRAETGAQAPDDMTPSPRQRYIEGLRLLASVLEANENLPLPYEGASTAITFHYLGGENPREAMAEAARLIPSTWRKEVSDESEKFPAYIDLVGNLAGVKVRLVAFRDTVCKRVVTGTEDREVEEVVMPAVTRMVTKPVEVVEWDCGSLLGPRPMADEAPKAVA